MSSRVALANLGAQRLALARFTGRSVPARRSGSEAYARLHRDGFADWRLSIEGLVTRPGSYSLADLKRLSARTQITRHTCEEGWSARAEWSGVPLGLALEAAGIRSEAIVARVAAIGEV